MMVAVCQAGVRSASVMMPARTGCPAGWTHEYSGYLMSEDSFSIRTGTIRHGASYVCVDDAPELATGPSSQDQARLFLVKVGCGSLPCSKYEQGAELACVVCTK